VVRLLREFGPLTRGELGELCGLSRTTLYEVVSGLVDGGLVLASVPDSGPRGRGRPAEKLALNPEAGCAVGIDFGRRAVRVVTMTVADDDIGRAHMPHPDDAPWPERIALAHRLAGSLTGGGLRHGLLSGVGVSVPDPAPGPATPAEQRTVAVMTGRAFGTRARLDTASRLAALAESVWGAAEGQRDVLYLELSEEVGGGLVSGGALHRGAHGRSGRFGHITVEAEGLPCGCGGRGCLQTVASTGAVLRACPDMADVTRLVAAARSGEPAARAAVARAGSLAGRVLAGLVHAVEPGVVVVGGELPTVGTVLLEPLEREMRAHATLRGPGSSPPVRPAALGEFAAALGALSLLRRPGRRTGPGLPSGAAVGVRCRT
jgi:predicted NBD/HSP70 family sugar kinase